MRILSIAVGLLFMTAASIVPGEPSEDAPGTLEKSTSSRGAFEHYLACELSYFTETECEGPLFRGLRARILGRDDEAEDWLLRAVAVAPEELKSQIYRELASLNYETRRWARGLYFDLLADPSTGLEANARRHFPKYPPESLETTDSVVSVDLDGFYVKGSINGGKETEPIIVDTGAEVTVATRSMAEEYGLVVESTAYEGSATGFGLPTSWGSSLLKRLTIDDAEFRNMPILVVDDEVLTGLGLNARFVLGMPEMMQFESVTFDFGRKRFVMRRYSEGVEGSPNFAIMDLKIIVELNLDGERATGFVDTGSPWTRLFLSERWNPERASGNKSRKVSWNVGGETYTRQLFRYRAELPGGLTREIDLSIVPDETPEHRFEYDALLGNNLWDNKAMTIDFVNQRLEFK